MKHLFIFIAKLWQWGPSRMMPPTCRYTPSCSQYAIEALEVHGAIKGSWLAIKRLLRCHPWGGYGYDPVPPAYKPSDITEFKDDSGGKSA